MRENVFVKNEENSESPFKLATVGTIYDDGISLILDGDDTPSQKKYKRLRNVAVNEGQRVLCVKMGKTSYIIIGELYPR